MYLRFKPRKTYFFRDVLYEYIELSDIEVKAIIDTVVFQRLRYLHQTQLARFVYHSADHTRFQHSLGVAYLMTKFIEQYIKELEEAEDIPKELKEEFNEAVRNELILASKIAALLHDVGHAFLSHLAELVELISHKYDHKYISYKLFDKYFAKRLREYINKYYKGVINADKVINFTKALLKPIEPDDVLTTDKIYDELYKELGSHKDCSIYLVPVWQILHAWLYTVDELDYLMRDGYFTGAIEHGMLDWYRLIRQTTLYYHGKGYLALGIKSPSRFLPAYRRFLMAYKNMYDIVSFHKTTLSFETALLLSLVAGSACRRELARLLNSIIDCLNQPVCNERELTRLLIESTDDNIIRLIHENYVNESSPFREMLEKFLNRDPPFKVVLQAMYDLKPPIVRPPPIGNELKKLSAHIKDVLNALDEELKRSTGGSQIPIFDKQERKVYAWNYKGVDYGILAYVVIRKPKVYKYSLEDSEVYIREDNELDSIDNVLWMAGESGIIVKFIVYVRDIIAENKGYIKELGKVLLRFERRLLKDYGFMILQKVRSVSQQTS